MGLHRLLLHGALELHQYAVPRCYQLDSHVLQQIRIVPVGPDSRQDITHRPHHSQDSTDRLSASDIHCRTTAKGVPAQSEHRNANPY